VEFFSFLPSIEFLLNFANDDAFFYIKTAYNFSKGFGSTFDLVNETNGYHPLWFIVLSIYFFILNLFMAFSPELYYRLVVLLIYTISLSTLFILSKIFKINNSAIAGKELLLLTPLFITFVAIRDYGLEPHLICLLIALYLYVKSVELNSNVSLVKYKCILLTLLFLVRIDFLFVVIPVIALSDYLLTPGAYKRRYLLSALFSILTISLIYFLSNYFLFGSFFTISENIKNTFPDTLFITNLKLFLIPELYMHQFTKLMFVLFSVLTFSILMLNKKLRCRFQKIDFFIFSLCISALLYLLLHLLFGRHNIKEWYFAFPMFVSSIMLIRIVIQFPKIYFLSLSTFIFVFLLFFYVTRIKNIKWDSVYYYALEIKKNTNENDKIFMIDLSGLTGFFSERKVINGDGLINSFENREYLLSDNLEKYFQTKKINFYSTYANEKETVQIKDSLDYYIDSRFSYRFGGYSFVFPKESLKLKFPLFFSHYSPQSINGYWYLFKIGD